MIGMVKQKEEEEGIKGRTRMAPASGMKNFRIYMLQEAQTRLKRGPTGTPATIFKTSQWSNRWGETWMEQW